MSKRSKASQTIMAELGLSDLQFQHYREMFTDNRRSRPYYEMVLDSSAKRLKWSFFSYQWSPKMVLQHLKGERTIGLQPKPYLQYLMIDLDNHGHPEVSVEDRARRVLSALEGNPLIYTSSHSDGFRVVYFLDKPYYVKQIDNFARDTFSKAGITVESGFIEIRAKVESDCLPFGDGSYIVDPITLTPIYDITKGGQIDYAYTLYNQDRLELPAAYCTDRPKNEAGVAFFQSTERLLREGLYPGICTNEALWSIISYLYKTFGFEKTKLESFAYHWLRECHNGRSDSINDGDYAKNEKRIAEMILKFDPSKMKNSGGFFRHPASMLSLSDVEKITVLTSDYKTQLRLFGLLSYSKANGVRFPSLDCAKELLVGSPATAIVDPLCTAESDEVWMCNIPCTVWREQPGFSASGYVKQRKALYDLGLLGLIYEGSYEQKRCACYAIRFEYDDASPLVSSLDDGLYQLFGSGGLIKTYGYYRTRKIAEHVQRNNQTTVPIGPMSLGA